MTIEKNSRILIVGLGLIGGSYAMALSKKGYSVTAISKEQADIDYAVEKGIIKSGSTQVCKETVSGADIIIFALYPHIFVEWMKEYGGYISEGTLVTDVTGVKGAVIEKINSYMPKNAEFIAAHPMAGKEVYGVKNADDTIFIDANFIVVPTRENTPEAIEKCKALGEVLGFRRVSFLNPNQHDEMIAFLSQLTHCIAISLMCANGDPNLVSYTGDSFRDLTRIANINEEMWSELFLLNKNALLYEMDCYRTCFDKLYNAVKDEDEDTLKSMMRLSTSRRKMFNKDGKNL
ncbi:MAG: prephenate dehydrogenase [Clostridia bacterium]|nr:prephenate dehydrogenase [Clostridia bacterium]